MPDVSSWQRAQRMEYLNKQGGGAGPESLLLSPKRSLQLERDGGDDEEIFYPDADGMRTGVRGFIIMLFLLSFLYVCVCVFFCSLFV